MNRNSYDWIYENGGPAIKLRMLSYQGQRKSATEVEKEVEVLLRMPEVQKQLGYMEGFHTEVSEKKVLEHLIHYFGDMCIDQFFPMLTEFGFLAGTPSFDRLMLPLKTLFLKMMKADYDYCFFYGLMLHRVFFITGFVEQDIIASMEHRINLLHKAAKERIYDIFQDGSRLPKPPVQWRNRGIIKEEMDPFSRAAELPLPTIYDISAMAYYQQYNQNPEIQKKVDDIIEYILTEEFQALPEGYGILWMKTRRTYYACGWNPLLPMYEDYPRPGHLGHNAILNYLSLMSNFSIASESKWFVDALNHIEQFRTVEGTYLFPKEYLGRKCSAPGFVSGYMGFNTNKHEIYLNTENMKLKYKERDALIREMISTLNVLEIKDRILQNKAKSEDKSI